MLNVPFVPYYEVGGAKPLRRYLVGPPKTMAMEGVKVSLDRNLSRPANSRHRTLWALHILARQYFWTRDCTRGSFGMLQIGCNAKPWQETCELDETTGAGLAWFTATIYIEWTQDATLSVWRLKVQTLRVCGGAQTYLPIHPESWQPAWELRVLLWVIFQGIAVAMLL